MSLRLFFILLFIAFNSFGQQRDFFVQLNRAEDKDLLHQLIPDAEVYCPFLLPEMQRTFVVKTNHPATAELLSQKLKGRIDFIYVEEIPTYSLFYTPNDLNASQYYLSLIQAQGAWDLNNSAAGIKIGVIDNAIDLTHPDLAANIWTNPGEIAANGLDDDGNGIIDDVQGYDFGDNDNDPNPNNSTFYHGTHVAGLASAVTDNSIGMASLGSNASIIPIKIANSNGSLVGAYLGVDYAIAIGSDVINMSWGGGTYSATYQLLFDIAYANDIVCIAAAGNSNISLPMYPASYNYVISVAATDQTDQKAGFSNYGSTIDLAAPGAGIFSTMIDPPGSYGNLNGTSMAAPIVAGLAALMRATDPLATVDDIESCLESSCDPVVGTFASQLGAGRVNAYQAMQCITELSAEFTSNYTQVCPGMSIQFTNVSSGSGLTFNWSFPGGTPASSNQQNPLITYNVPGVYDVSLTISNGPTTLSNTQIQYIVVAQPTATILGNSTIMAGGIGSVVINFNGNPPYSLTIDDGTTPYSYTGITSNPYICYFSPVVTTNYTITAFSDAQCNGNYSGSAVINVQPGSLCDTLNSSMVKYLGTNLDDISSGVQDLGTYGFLVMGRKVVGANTFINYICRLDRCGSVIWEKLYNPTIYGIPVAAHMEGNEILVCGYNGTAGSSRTILTRLDLTGNVLSAQDFGANNATYPRYMMQSTNGLLTIGGVTNSTPSFGSNDTYVMRNTSSGSVIWQKRIGGSGDDFLHDLTEASNGDIITTGYCMNYISTLRSGYLCRLDANGNLLWMRRYDMGSGETVFDNVEEWNGFYYAVGRTNTSTYGGFDALITKVDQNGAIVWSKKIGGTGVDILHSIGIRNDTLYILGASASGAPNQELFVGLMDLSGNLLDYISLGTPTDDNTAGHGQQIALSADGDIYGVGYGNGGYLGGNDILFFKYNSFADTCQATEVQLQHSNIALQSNPMTPSVGTPTYSFINANWVPQDVISNQGFICSQNIGIIDTTCNIAADFISSALFCALDTVYFSDLSSPWDEASLAIWDFGDGSAPLASTDSILGHLYPGPGSYQVTLIAADTLNGCSDTISYAINLNLAPQIDLPDTLIICLGDTASVNFQQVCLSATAQSDWYNDSIIYMEDNNLAIVNPTVSQYLYVSVSDFGSTLIDSIFVLVDANCCNSLASIGVEWGPVCAGDTLYFENNSMSNGASPDYSWTFGPDASISGYNGSVPPGIIFGSSGAKYIILELSDSCGTTIDTLELNIFEVPEFAIGQGGILCQSDTVDLGEEAVSPWTYIWSPGGLVSDSTISNPTAYIDGPTTISVIVTDPWTGCSFYDTTYFDVDPSTAGISLQNVSACYGVPVELQPSVNGDVNGYLWSNGSDQPSIVVNEEGIYSVSVFTDCGTYSASAQVDFSVCNIVIPNILSLSSTVGNELWHITGDGLVSYHVTILDRWGALMYEYDGPGGGWNGMVRGKPASEGTYFYLVKGLDVMGEEFEQQGFLVLVH